MFRFIITLLLFNTYYQSFGIPVEPKTDLKTPGDIMRALAQDCNKNTFISSLITPKIITDCNISTSPYSKQQIQCLMFYDISSRLCSLSEKISEDSFKTINQQRNVSVMCNIAKDWDFISIKNFPDYYDKVNYVFKTDFCRDMCLMDGRTDSNFFCKYFKWGMDVLKAKTTENTGKSDQSSKQNDPPLLSNTTVVNSNTSVANSVLTYNKLKNPLTQPLLDHSTSETGNIVSEKIGTVVNQANIVNNASISENKNNVASNVKTNTEPDKDIIVGNRNPDSSHLNDKTLKIQSEIKDDMNIDSGIDGDKLGDIDNENDEDMDEHDGIDGADIADPNELLRPKQDSSLTSNKGEFKGNSQLGHDTDFDGADVVDNPNEILRQNQDSFTPIKGDSQRESFSSGLPDGFTDDDDDHFFSFFLTSVIVVIALYILYHNKNKFFGLILEGRNSGRRRSSRGHAYRRLDTLEQAISSKSAAPPSKIIY